MRLLAALTAALVLGLAPSAGAIVNGSVAQPGEFPWQVAVLPGQFFCGGTLIAADVVLTAAHCTAGMTPGQVTVRAGSLRYESGFQQLSVTDIANHPDAAVGNDTAAPRNDVALLKLSAPAPGAPIVPVAVGADDPLWTAPTTLTVSGWGLTEDGTGSLSSDLRYVGVERRSDSACASAWSADFDPADRFCALHVDTATGLVGDSCNGDSGGPIVAPAVAAPSRSSAADWRLVGTVSYGSESCTDAGVPGVYARVGAPAIHDFVADPAPQYMPYSTSAPVLAGTAVPGSTLACATGGWANGSAAEGTTYSYEFWRGSSILLQAGASAAYAVRAADAGSALQCVVVAHNAGGTAAANSNPLAITAAPGDLTAKQAPAPEPAPIVPEPVPQPAAAPQSAADTLAPVARLAGRTCGPRRCVLSVQATDEGGSGVRTVLVTLTRMARVRCGSRTCVRTRAYRVAVRRISLDRFELRTPRLPAGRYALSARAVDLAGNRQRRAARARLTLAAR